MLKILCNKVRLSNRFVECVLSTFYALIAKFFSPGFVYVFKCLAEGLDLVYNRFQGCCSLGKVGYVFTLVLEGP